MKTRHSTLRQQRGHRFWRALDAFSLLEVVIACAIFFMVAFALLELVTRSLVAAKALQIREPDPGLVLAMTSLMRSNAFEEGTTSGDFDEIAPDLYPGYQWVKEEKEVGSNGLWQVQVFVHNQRKNKGISQITGFFWCPNCKPGSATKPY